MAVVVMAFLFGAQPGVTPSYDQAQPVLVEETRVRRFAPDFELPSLRGSERIALRAFRGQVVVLNFFASWCQPCAVEAADLERAWQLEKGRGTVFLAVAVQDQLRDSRAFLARHGSSYPAVFDASGDVMDAYRVTGIPTTVLIDPEGRIAARHAGIFVGDEGIETLRARIKATRKIAP
jgi:peroxiredoxin